MFSTAYSMLGGKGSDLTATASSLDVIHVIRAGLPVAMLDNAVKIMGMNKSDFTSLVGISMRSTQRKVGRRLSPQQSEHTLMIIDVMVKGEHYFGDRETMLNWLNRPSPSFNNQPPISLFDTVTGIRTVADTINRLSHGMTA